MIIAVLTTEGVLFEIQGDYWVSERTRAEDGHIQVSTRIRCEGVEKPVAEFTDVHAVWQKAKGEMIREEDE